MKKDNNIIILKLGGSLLTEKNKPLSIREDVATSVVQQIISAEEKIILIHGGGSFGHPLAKKYSISKGLNHSIPNQIFGLTKTHDAMNKLNSFIINLFLEENFPVLSFQPSSIFLKDHVRILTKSIELIENALDLDILPILYGDIILEKHGSFSIISGDQIITELCKNLNKYRISKVIFATEIDGIFINDIQAGNKRIKLATKLSLRELEDLDLADLGQKIDVTGGMLGKINSIKNIVELNIPVQLLNGLKENYIFSSLKNRNVEGTNIINN
ncbi:MAG: isopentenyl phosphate kinase [Promethearchaeota archaeon]